MMRECFVRGFRLTATVVDDVGSLEESSLSLTDLKRKLLVQIWRHNSVAASKFIAWPEDKEPNKLDYDDLSETLLIYGTAQLVRLPIRLSRLVVLTDEGSVAASSSTSAGSHFSTVQRVESLLVRNVASHEDPSTAVILTAKQLLKNPDKSRVWKAFREQLDALVEETNADKNLMPSLGGFLSPTEQKELVNVLKTKSKGVDEVSVQLVRANVFGFEALDDLVEWQLGGEGEEKAEEGGDERGGKKLVKALLSCVTPLPDTTITRLLVAATKNDSTELVVKNVRRVLKGVSGWDDGGLREALSRLVLPHQALALLQASLAIYSTDKDLTDKALSLSALALDSQGSRLVRDGDVREQLLETAELISDLTALMDTFSGLKSRREAATKKKHMVERTEQVHVVVRAKCKKLTTAKPPASLIEP